ncbi:uncharacterized protein LOC124188300 isoform X3 [Daphnia pulex]|uniref:uncharacterized protein LOC124188300 isoform X3 n=1 Tax=Daphnia pulex TaxID=6669 RepID=UPI001EDCF1F1|nr:uncharacterized protein LOC124188300 isoform X3 [Daphnia pulex]XP_046436795.1 uncharacterized protein LOC124188300 isoform X3 [Daphnia pulex]XP_046436796.1 uncharacterized protein LOC124188300 isoform X3 [Daphnia pulex]
MARSSGSWLLSFLLAASLTAAAPSAINSTDPALDLKPVFFESVKNLENRKVQALQSDESHANYVRYKMSQQSATSLPLSPNIDFPSAQQLIHPDTYSIPDAPSYNKLNEYSSSIKMLKLQAEKYSSKLKNRMPINLKPHVAVAASRVWRTIPSRSEIADRAAFGIFTTLQNLLTPDLFIFGPIFLVAFVLTLLVNFFFGLTPVGRRRVGRNLSSIDKLSIAEDLNEIFDFDIFLPAGQSRNLASLSARLDRMLDAYRTAYKDDTCMEKYSCQAGGQMTSRIGRLTEPIITLLEPLVPANMYKILEAFKNGARSGNADCSKMKCKLPFDG